jgi:hypothetical protein
LEVSKTCGIGTASGLDITGMGDFKAEIPLSRIEASGYHRWASA